MNKTIDANCTWDSSNNFLATPLYMGANFAPLKTKWRGFLGQVVYDSETRTNYFVLDSGTKYMSENNLVNKFTNWHPVSTTSILEVPSSFPCKIEASTDSDNAWSIRFFNKTRLTNLDTNLISYADNSICEFYYSKGLFSTLFYVFNQVNFKNLVSLNFKTHTWASLGYGISLISADNFSFRCNNSLTFLNKCIFNYSVTRLFTKNWFTTDNFNNTQSVLNWRLNSSNFYIYNIESLFFLMNFLYNLNLLVSKKDLIKPLFFKFFLNLLLSVSFLTIGLKNFEILEIDVSLLKEFLTRRLNLICNKVFFTSNKYLLEEEHFYSIVLIIFRKLFDSVKMLLKDSLLLNNFKRVSLKSKVLNIISREFFFINGLMLASSVGVNSYLLRNESLVTLIKDTTTFDWKKLKYGKKLLNNSGVSNQKKNSSVFIVNAGWALEEKNILNILDKQSSLITDSNESSKIRIFDSIESSLTFFSFWSINFFNFFSISNSSRISYNNLIAFFKIVNRVFSIYSFVIKSLVHWFHIGSILSLSKLYISFKNVKFYIVGLICGWKSIFKLYTSFVRSFFFEIFLVSFSSSSDNSLISEILPIKELFSSRKFLVIRDKSSSQSNFQKKLINNTFLQFFWEKKFSSMLNSNIFLVKFPQIYVNFLIKLRRITTYFESFKLHLMSETRVKQKYFTRLHWKYLHKLVKKKAWINFSYKLAVRSKTIFNSDKKITSIKNSFFAPRFNSKLILEQSLVNVNNRLVNHFSFFLLLYRRFLHMPTIGFHKTAFFFRHFKRKLKIRNKLVNISLQLISSQVRNIKPNYTPFFRIVSRANKASVFMLNRRKLIRSRIAKFNVGFSLPVVKYTRLQLLVRLAQSKLNTYVCNTVLEKSIFDIQAIAKTNIDLFSFQNFNSVLTLNQFAKVKLFLLLNIFATKPILPVLASSLTFVFYYLWGMVVGVIKETFIGYTQVSLMFMSFLKLVEFRAFWSKSASRHLDLVYSNSERFCYVNKFLNLQFFDTNKFGLSFCTSGRFWEAYMQKLSLLFVFLQKAQASASLKLVSNTHTESFYHWTYWFSSSRELKRKLTKLIVANENKAAKLNKRSITRFYIQYMNYLKMIGRMLGVEYLHLIGKLVRITLKLPFKKEKFKLRLNHVRRLVKLSRFKKFRLIAARILKFASLCAQKRQSLLKLAKLLENPASYKGRLIKLKSKLNKSKQARLRFNNIFKSNNMWFRPFLTKPSLLNKFIELKKTLKTSRNSKFVKKLNATNHKVFGKLSVFGSSELSAFFNENLNPSMLPAAIASIKSWWLHLNVLNQTTARSYFRDRFILGISGALMSWGGFLFTSKYLMLCLRFKFSKYGWWRALILRKAAYDLSSLEGRFDFKNKGYCNLSRKRLRYNANLVPLHKHQKFAYDHMLSLYRRQRYFKSLGGLLHWKKSSNIVTPTRLHWNRFLKNWLSFRKKIGWYLRSTMLVIKVQRTFNCDMVAENKNFIYLRNVVRLFKLLPRIFFKRLCLRRKRACIKALTRFRLGNKNILNLRSTMSIKKFRFWVKMPNSKHISKFIVLARSLNVLTATELAVFSDSLDNTTKFKSYRGSISLKYHFLNAVRRLFFVLLKYVPSKIKFKKFALMEQDIFNKWDYLSVGSREKIKIAKARMYKKSVFFSRKLKLVKRKLRLKGNIIRRYRFLLRKRNFLRRKKVRVNKGLLRFWSKRGVGVFDLRSEFKAVGLKPAFINYWLRARYRRIRRIFYKRRERKKSKTLKLKRKLIWLPYKFRKARRIKYYTRRSSIFKRLLYSLLHYKYFKKDKDSSLVNETVAKLEVFNTMGITLTSNLKLAEFCDAIDELRTYKGKLANINKSRVAKLNVNLGSYILWCKRKISKRLIVLNNQSRLGNSFCIRALALNDLFQYLRKLRKMQSELSSLLSHEERGFSYLKLLLEGSKPTNISDSTRSLLTRKGVIYWQAKVGKFFKNRRYRRRKKNVKLRQVKSSCAINYLLLSHIKINTWLRRTWLNQLSQPKAYRFFYSKRTNSKFNKNAKFADKKLSQEDFKNKRKGFKEKVTQFVSKNDKFSEVSLGSSDLFLFFNRFFSIVNSFETEYGISFWSNVNTKRMFNFSFKNQFITALKKNFSVCRSPMYYNYLFNRIKNGQKKINLFRGKLLGAGFNLNTVVKPSLNHFYAKFEYLNPTKFLANVNRGVNKKLMFASSSFTNRFNALMFFNKLFVEFNFYINKRFTKVEEYVTQDFFDLCDFFVFVFNEFRNNILRLLLALVYKQWLLFFGKSYKNFLLKNKVLFVWFMLLNVFKKTFLTSSLILQAASFEFNGYIKPKFYLQALYLNLNSNKLFSEKSLYFGGGINSNSARINNSSQFCTVGWARIIPISQSLSFFFALTKSYTLKDEQVSDTFVLLSALSARADCYLNSVLTLRSSFEMTSFNVLLNSTNEGLIVTQINNKIY